MAARYADAKTFSHYQLISIHGIHLFSGSTYGIALALRRSINALSEDGRENSMFSVECRLCSESASSLLRTPKLFLGIAESMKIRPLAAERYVRNRTDLAS